MLFSEIIKPENVSEKNAFLLGMIYEWPIFLDDNTKVLAYSSFKPEAGGTNGPAMNFLNNTHKTKSDYVDLHYDKLVRYLGEGYTVLKNDSINASRVSNGRQIGSGVSVIFDFDLQIPENVDAENFILGIIEKWLIDIDESYKNMFFTGVIDSRCSLDHVRSYATIDLAKKQFPEISRRKLNKYSDIVGTICNFNPRLTQGESSSNKNDQFRINLYYFVGHFGFFTPFRIDYYKHENGLPITNNVDNNYFYIDDRYSTTELNVGAVSGRNVRINELAIRLKQQGINEEEKKQIISQYRIENLIDDDDDEILHSSQNVKEAAKIRDNYQCEMDHNHVTFSAKSNGMNYVEAHHLIPFSEREHYDLSIDVVENIVCLCPNCHRKIHLAIDDQKKQLLDPLFDRKIKSLNNVGIELSRETLYRYYGIN